MSVHLQKITVGFEYPVYFSSDLFAVHNLDLVEAVARKEPGRRHRIFAVVERAVAEARPRHLGDIRAYAECHRDRLELVVDPLVVEGGEAAKNDAAAPARLQGRFQAARMDRSDVLGLLAREDRSGHLEVETCTWDVLPDEYRREDIVTAVARELHWVMERLPA